VTASAPSGHQGLDLVSGHPDRANAWRLNARSSPDWPGPSCSQGSPGVRRTSAQQLRRPLTVFRALRAEHLHRRTQVFDRPDTPDNAETHWMVEPMIEAMLEELPGT
jgi:hypothetical protein